MPSLQVAVDDPKAVVRIEYDADGYVILVDGEVRITRRLALICYQFGPREREAIARKHALMDVRCELSIA